MNFEAVLNYATVHNQAIIQWLVVLILALVGTLIALALFGRGGEAAPSAHAGLPDAGELTETLKKLMAQTPTAPESGATPAPAGVTSGDAAPTDALARVRALETELSRRDEEIAQLKTAPATAAGGAADPALGARLQELEAKLSEYEILEDDIADLSLYKEENTRLRTELENLKTSGGGPGASAPEALAASPEPESDPVVASAATAADDEPAQPARTAEAAAEAAASFAAFEAAAPAPANAPIPRDLNAEADDLFAEFATALEESGVDLSADSAPAKTSA